MLKNMMRVVLTNRSAAIALAVAVILPIAFNNCSAQLAFEASQDSRLASLNTSGVVVINNGDEFTNATNVTLAIAHASADRMYVTSDPTCESGGAWEPISSSKAWNLANLNTVASVYVKFSNDGVLASECLSDSIVHDDIAPVVNVATAPAAFTNATDISTVLESTDGGSGVASASCIGTTSSSDCSPSSLLVKSPLEGSHSFAITVKDRAGNSSLPKNVAFVVDRTVPSVALNLTPSSISNQVSSTFQFSGADTLSGIDRFECRAGSANAVASLPMQSCVTGFNINLQSGQNRFEVRAVDRAGNTSASVAYSWLIDLGAPTVQITRSPRPISNMTQATFEFTGTDDGGPLASYSCRLDSGAAVSCTSPFTSPAGLTEGNHSFSVTGTDAAGNASTPATYAWIIDTTLPVLTITSMPAPITNMTSANFVLAASDANGIESIECQLDGGGYAPCATTVNYPLLADGDHTFLARARDRAGNVSATVNHRWTIDTSKPVVTVASGPAPWVNVRAATLTLAVTDVNVAPTLSSAKLECKINGSNFTACSSPVSYSGLNETSHMFTVRAVDAAGNMSDEVVHTWAIDLTPPAINIGKQPASLLYKTQPAEVAFAVTDALSGLQSVTCGVNGLMAECNANYTTTLMNLPPGLNRFTINATDKATNTVTRDLTWTISDRHVETIQYVDVNRSNKLDVLVVIDNSGSMKNEHANMAARFGTFIDQLDNLDWQVGIVTTDVSGDAIKKDGRLVEFRAPGVISGGPSTGTGKYVISSAMDKATAKAWFAATIQMETNGSGNEQGVAASYRAVQRSQQAGNATSLRNAELFRTDSALSILVVTDADETNPAGTQNQNRPETLIGMVQTTWPGKPFSFHSIIVPINDSVCRSRDGNEGYGYNYVSTSQLTGGILGTVCATDYGTQLRDIGQSTQELVLSVGLLCAPIDVSGDGAPEFTILTSDGSTPPTYTFEGMRVKFATALPAGRTRLTYNCIAPL